MKLDATKGKENLTKICKTYNVNTLNKYHNFVCVDDFASILYRAQKSKTNMDLNILIDQTKAKLVNLAITSGFKQAEDAVLGLAELLRTPNKMKEDEIKEILKAHFSKKGIQIPCANELADVVLEAANDIFSDQERYPEASDYVKRLVDDFYNAEYCNEHDSVRMKILKHLIMVYEGDNQNICEALSSLLKIDISKKERQSAILKYFKEEYFEHELLKSIDIVKSANELSNGHFRRSGGVRVHMFLLAYAFQLKYYLPHEKKTADYNIYRDIETVLFENFHGRTDLNDPKLGGGEQIPVSAGINYKNFVEVCYLYGLRHHYAYKSIDRLNQRCIEYYASNRKVKKTEVEVTYTYQNHFVDFLENEDKRYEKAKANLMNLKMDQKIDEKAYKTLLKTLREDLFVEYVATHYICENRAITNFSDQVSAYQEYEEMINAIVINRAQELSFEDEAFKQELNKLMDYFSQYKNMKTQIHNAVLDLKKAIDTIEKELEEQKEYLNHIMDLKFEKKEANNFFKPLKKQKLEVLNLHEWIKNNPAGENLMMSLGFKVKEIHVSELSSVVDRYFDLLSLIKMKPEIYEMYQLLNASKKALEDINNVKRCKLLTQTMVNRGNTFKGIMARSTLKDSLNDLNDLLEIFKENSKMYEEVYNCNASEYDAKYLLHELGVHNKQKQEAIIKKYGVKTLMVVCRKVIKKLILPRLKDEQAIYYESDGLLVQNRWRLLKDLDLIVENNHYVSFDSFWNLEAVLTDRELFEKTAKNLDRFTFMIVFMYWYFEENPIEVRPTFNVFKKQVLEQLNTRLEKSRYQKFDEKNFFDMIVLLTLYRELFVVDETEGIEW